MTDQELSEIEERAKKASAAPWTRNGKAAGGWRIDDCDENRAGLGFLLSPTAIVPNDDNATFIAEAREDIPNLVAEVRRLREALEEAKVNVACDACKVNAVAFDKILGPLK